MRRKSLRLFLKAKGPPDKEPYDPETEQPVVCIDEEALLSLQRKYPEKWNDFGWFTFLVWKFKRKETGRKEERTETQEGSQISPKRGFFRIPFW